MAGIGLAELVVVAYVLVVLAVVPLTIFVIRKISARSASPPGPRPPHED